MAATSPSPFGEVLSFRFVRVRLGFGEQERERLFAWAFCHPCFDCCTEWLVISHHKVIQSPISFSICLPSLCAEIYPFCHFWSHFLLIFEFNLWLEVRASLWWIWGARSCAKSSRQVLHICCTRSSLKFPIFPLILSSFGDFFKSKFELVSCWLETLLWGGITYSNHALTPETTSKCLISFSQNQSKSVPFSCVIHFEVNLRSFQWIFLDYLVLMIEIVSPKSHIF